MRCEPRCQGSNTGAAIQGDARTGCSVARCAASAARPEKPFSPTRKPCMAESTSVLESSAVPAEDLERVEKFTREPFVHEAEDPVIVLAPGTPRRRALDD